jgi:hypothetical protein
MRKKGPYGRELLKKLIDGVKGTEETNPTDSKKNPTLSHLAPKERITSSTSQYKTRRR